MARGINKVIIVGNLGQDPEIRSFPDDGMIANISVATSESWRDKQTGQMHERTEWHRIVLKDRGNYRLGEIAAQYLRKGSKVYIEGSLRTRKWQDQQGMDRYTTEIIASEMQMVDTRSDNQQSASHNYSTNQQGASHSYAAHKSGQQVRNLSHVEQQNAHHSAPSPGNNRYSR